MTDKQKRLLINIPFHVVRSFESTTDVLPSPPIPSTPIGDVLPSLRQKLRQKLLPRDGYEREDSQSSDWRCRPPFRRERSSIRIPTNKTNINWRNFTSFMNVYIRISNRGVCLILGFYVLQQHERSHPFRALFGLGKLFSFWRSNLKIYFEKKNEKI